MVAVASGAASRISAPVGHLDVKSDKPAEDVEKRTMAAAAEGRAVSARVATMR
jgi:hypothetical protein